MEFSVAHAITVFMAFFAIMNPVAGIPVFLSLTSEFDEHTTRGVAVRSLLVAFGIILFFSVAGKVLFDAFGLTLPAFRITGGIVVFSIGLHMLQGYHSRIQHPSDDDKRNSRDAALNVAISPLGTPLLAGPGTIATAMNFSAGGRIFAMVVTVVVFALLCVITYLCFIFGKKFAHYVGSSGLGVVTRLMGLILAAIGTQMVIEGLREAFNIGG